MNSQDKLQALVKKYVDGLGERWAVLADRYREIMEAIDAQQDLRHLEALSLLHYDAHKLAGSAGSMGLDDLGKAAGALDVYMSAVESRGDSFNDVDLKQFSALYKNLESLLLCQSWRDSTVLKGCGPDGATGMLKPSVHPDATDVIALGTWPADAGAGGLSEMLVPFGLTLVGGQFERVHEYVENPNTALIMVDQDLVSAISWPLDSSIPILAVGKSATLEDRIALVRAGIHSLVSPPVDAFDVVDIIDRYRQKNDVKPIKVALVDDDPALVSLLDYQFVTAGMEVVSLNSPDRILEVLAAEKPEVLVLDRNMPMWDGFDVAMVVRQVPAYADLPLVFLTADQRPDSRLAALALGGDDYIHKPVDGHHLATLVRTRALRARALRQKIITDGLTGLLNHIALVSEAQHMCSLARRLKNPFSVALLDLDHFKSINDTYGHQAGDSVLRGMSRMLRQRLRGADVIGRMGGEEFGIVLPNTSLEQAVKVLDTLRTAFAQLEFSYEGHVFQVTFSAGVAAAGVCSKAGECQFSAVGLHLGECSDVTTLFRLADEALYDAKRMGRNRISMAQA